MLCLPESFQVAGAQRGIRSIQETKITCMLRKTDLAITYDCILDKTVKKDICNYKHI